MGDLRKFSIKAKWLDPTPPLPGDPPRKEQWVLIGWASEQPRGGGISCKLFATPLPGWDGTFALFPREDA